MNQPASPPNPSTEVKQSEIPTRPIVDPKTNEPISITDRDLMIYLIWKKFMWSDLRKKDGFRTIFVFSRTEEIELAIEGWRSPIPIVVSDIREVFMAERIFNSAVHDKF